MTKQKIKIIYRNGKIKIKEGNIFISESGNFIILTYSEDSEHSILGTFGYKREYLRMESVKEIIDES
jgi:hypothetical protein